jgi:protein phosphatase
MKVAGRTDVGKQRAANEDSILMLPEFGLVCVADGMGGHRGGRVASQMVTTELARIVREAGHGLDGDELAGALIEINERIHDMGSKTEELHAMGSTCVAASLQEDQLHLAHVGDSRCYLSRDGEGRRLTSDHRAIQPMIDQGALSESESRQHPLRNVLTRSVGVEPSIDVEVQTFELRPRDRLLLCSDGLSDLVDQGEILEVLGSARPLEEIAEELVQRANEAGGTDNISVVLVENSAPAS